MTSAVKLVTFTDSKALFDNLSYQELISKHPVPVTEAINSFNIGSAWGLDYLRSVHLKDVISKNAGFFGEKLRSSLTALCNFILLEQVNHDIYIIL